MMDPFWSGNSPYVYMMASSSVQKKIILYDLDCNIFGIKEH